MDANQNLAMSTEAHLELLQKKVDFLVEEARISKRIRKITLIVTIVMFVAPVLIIMLILPSILSSITSAYSI